jgi:hypothetical protein
VILVIYPLMVLIYRSPAKPANENVQLDGLLRHGFRRRSALGFPSRRNSCVVRPLDIRVFRVALEGDVIPPFAKSSKTIQIFRFGEPSSLELFATTDTLHAHHDVFAILCQ